MDSKTTNFKDYLIGIHNELDLKIQQYAKRSAEESQAGNYCVEISEDKETLRLIRSAIDDFLVRRIETAQPHEYLAARIAEELYQQEKAGELTESAKRRAKTLSERICKEEPIDAIRKLL